MPKSKTNTKPAAAELNGDATNTEGETTTELDAKTPAKKPAATDDDSGANAFRAELAKFTKTFGSTNGAKWFGEGVTFPDALANQCRHLETELAARDETIKELNEKLASLNPGENEAVSSSGDASGDGTGDKKTFQSLFTIKK